MARSVTQESTKAVTGLGAGHRIAEYRREDALVQPGGSPGASFGRHIRPLARREERSWFAPATDEQRSRRAEGSANLSRDFRRAVLGPGDDVVERAIIAILSGASVAQQAHNLGGISAQQLQRWVDSYRQAGREALRRSRGQHDEG